MSFNWEPNPGWRELDAPEERDIVQLKATNGFDVLVKLFVSHVTENKITGIVDSVYDWHNKGQIHMGHGASLVGKEMEFDKKYMQNVIKHRDNS